MGLAGISLPPHPGSSSKYGRMPEADREVLWLVGNDGLTAKHAVAVLGISPTAHRLRLMRARRALGVAMQASGSEADCEADLTPREAQG